MRNEVIALPMDAYLKEYGVSQSQLKELARSPAHLRQYLDHPPESTPDQIIGHITHTAILEPHLFETCCWMRPANYQNKKGEWKRWNGNATEAKDWKAAHSDRPIVPFDTYAEIEGMREAVRKHPAAALALREGAAEMCLFCEDPETGVQQKCRTDWLSGTAIVDVKTCQDASPTGFAKTIANFGYAIQAAYNLDIAAWLGLKKEVFIFIAVEKKPPYATAVYQLDDAAIEIGRSQYRRLLARYMECLSSEKWPAYSSNIEFLSLPAWSKKGEFDAAQMYYNPAAPALEIA